jgi:hypothetical protein
MYSPELLMMDGKTVRNMRSAELQFHLVPASKQFHLDAASKQVAVCLTYTCCCMYSSELLMMNGKTVQNMQSVI